MNHLEFAAQESESLRPTSAERYLVEVERRIRLVKGQSFDLDGDECIDGYCLDSTVDAYRNGLSVEQCVSAILGNMYSLDRY